MDSGDPIGRNTNDLTGPGLNAFGQTPMEPGRPRAFAEANLGNGARARWATYVDLMKTLFRTPLGTCCRGVAREKAWGPGF